MHTDAMKVIRMYKYDGMHVCMLVCIHALFNTCTHSHACFLTSMQTLFIHTYIHIHACKYVMYVCTSLSSWCCPATVLVLHIFLSRLHCVLVASCFVVSRCHTSPGSSSRYFSSWLSCWCTACCFSFSSAHACIHAYIDSYIHAFTCMRVSM